MLHINNDDKPYVISAKISRMEAFVIASKQRAKAGCGGAGAGGKT